MLQLSIVIPVLGQSQPLEDTLVSVLANRPDDCEVLVVLNDDYGDPYDLGEEVRFVDAPLGADWIECVNLAISHCRAPLVHWLAPGVEVDDGWTQPALVCFADPRVAAVTPAVLDRADPQRVLSAGMMYSRGGAIQCFGQGRKWSALASDKRSAQQAVAASLAAGFYRKSMLDELEMPMEPALGQEAAPIDLALNLRKLGYRTICQPASQVFASAECLVASASPLQRALGAERLFLRQTARRSWPTTLVSHAVAVAGEFLSTLPSSACVTQLLGRAAAWLRFREHRSHLAEVEQLALELTEIRQQDSGKILHMHDRQRAPQQKLRDAPWGRESFRL